MIDRLMLYKELIEDETVRSVASFMLSKDGSYLCSILRRIYEKTNVSPHSYEDYLYDLIMSSENEFSLSCEKSGRKALENVCLLDIVKRDLAVIRELFSISSKFNIHNGSVGKTAERFLSGSCADTAAMLADDYYTGGCGCLRRSQAFMWDKGLNDVRMPDDVVFDSLIGYEHHKKKIIANTRAFSECRPCHNVLLFGDRGTGKSSCVKAAFNMFRDRRVRIIELYKSNISQIQDVMTFAGSRGFRFILFLDDLSFEENEYEYKELKAHLEGGIESQPENVAIYATSNRFHIVKEIISDNAFISNEIHLNDSVQEKLSLSDRFGLTITFDTPVPGEYSAMIVALLERENIIIPPDALKKMVNRWMYANHGRSGRSAVQFVRTVMSGIDEDLLQDGH